MLSYKALYNICINGSPRDIEEAIMQNTYPDIPKCRVSRKIIFMKEHHEQVKRCIPDILDKYKYDNLRMIMQLDDSMAPFVLSNIRGPSSDLTEYILGQYGYLHYQLLTKCSAANNIERVKEIIKAFNYDLCIHKQYIKIKYWKLSLEMFLLVSKYSDRAPDRLLAKIIKHNNFELLEQMSHVEITEDMIPYIRSKEMYEHVLSKIGKGPFDYNKICFPKKLYKASKEIRELIHELFRSDHFDNYNTGVILSHYFECCPGDFLEKFEEALLWGFSGESLKYLLGIICSDVGKVPEQDRIRFADKVFKAIGQDFRSIRKVSNMLIILACPSVFEQMTYKEIPVIARKYCLEYHYACLSNYWANYFGINIPKKMNKPNKLYDITIIAQE